MKTLKGYLNISRIFGKNDDVPIRITLEDEKSGTIIANVHVSLENFAEVLMGYFRKPCEIEYFNSPVIGMKSENKNEAVPVPDTIRRKGDGWIKKALKPFEVDGWIARESDMHNHHCTFIKDKQYYQNVIFFRHVDEETGKPYIPPKK